MRTRGMGLVAALLLVALGVALGAGPLQGDADRRAREAEEQRAGLAQRDSRIADLHRSDDMAAAYAGATAARVVAGRLADRKVAVVTLPGSDPGTVEALERLLATAGAAVTARVALTEDLLDPGSQGLVDALSSQMIAENPGVAAPAAATGWPRIGALLARAIGVPLSAGAAGAPYDPTAVGILSGLEAAKLATPGTTTERAGLAVFVLPAADPGSPALVEVLNGFAAQVPTVAAGPTGAAGSPLARARAAEDARFSTVDSVDGPVGRVVAVLALEARARGVLGSYGSADGVDAAVPPAS